MSDELNEANVAELDTGLTQEDLDGDDKTTNAQEAAPANEEGEGEDGENPKKLEGEAKRISVLTARNYALLAEIDRLKNARNTETETAAKAADKAPEVPEFPNEDMRWENPTEYRKQIQARDDAIAELAAWKAEQRISERQQATAQTQRQREQQEHHNEIVTAFVENGIQAGISEERMQENEKILAKYKFHSDTALYVYADEAGAKIIDFLCANPKELEALSKLPPTQAAVKIANEIRPRALSKKPHVTTAPDPTSPTRGQRNKQVDEWENVGKGATFS